MEIPNLTQFFGGGPVAPPDGVSTDPALDFSIPSPWENPDLWDSVIFTLKSDPTVTFTLPPVGMGRARLKVPLAAKIDSKSGAGKNAPKVTKTGKDKVKDKCKIEAVDEAWPYISAAAKKMTVGSGPWKVSHPKFTFPGITEVLISKIMDSPDEDSHGHIVWEFEYQNVDPNAQSGKGGGNATSTPDNGKTTTVKGFGGNSNVITIGADPGAKKVDPNQSFVNAQSNATNP